VTWWVWFGAAFVVTLVVGLIAWCVYAALLDKWQRDRGDGNG